MTRLQKIDQFNRAVLKVLAYLTRRGITWRFGPAYRTKEQAEWNVKKGVGILNSKHRYSLAIDIWITYKGWDVVWNKDDPNYKIIGKYAEKQGLKWGGRFKGKTKGDVYHLEYKGRI